MDDGKLCQCLDGSEHTSVESNIDDGTTSWRIRGGEMAAATSHHPSAWRRNGAGKGNAVSVWIVEGRKKIMGRAGKLA